MRHACAALQAPVGVRCADGEQEEEGDEDRVDQQMGDAGDEAEAVDERMWDEEDKEEQQGKQVGGG